MSEFDLHIKMNKLWKQYWLQNRFQKDISIMIAFIWNFKKWYTYFMGTNNQYGLRLNQLKNGGFF